MPYPPLLIAPYTKAKKIVTTEVCNNGQVDKGNVVLMQNGIPFLSFLLSLDGTRDHGVR